MRLSRTLRSRVKTRRWIALVASVLAVLGLVTVVTAGPAQAAAGTVKGRVYLDYDADGQYDTGHVGDGLANDPGQAGVTVTAYDSTNHAVGTATSAADGTYTLTVTAAASTKLRLDFTTLPTGDSPSHHGTDNATNVQFVNIGATGADFGVLDPDLYSQDSPILAEPIMDFGDPVNGNNKDMPAIVGSGYTSGDGTQMYGGSSTTCVAPTCYAAQSDVGTVWGLTSYTQPASQDGYIFSSAFYRRYAGMGPGGTGAIYRTDTKTRTTTVFANLNTIFGAGTAGTDPRTGYAPNTSTSVLGDWINDETNDLVGRTALGGLDMDPAGTNLYTVNLHDKQLYTIPVANPTTATRTPVPLATGAEQGCPAADTLPFSVTYHDGLIYVGETCDAQTSADATALRGYIYTYNTSTHAWSTGPVFEMPFNYTRTGGKASNYFSNDASWRPWVSIDPQYTNTAADSGLPPAGDYSCPAGNCQQQYPQPWFTGLTFDGDDLIIGLRDRFDDQAIGYKWQNAATPPRTVGGGTPDGDLLRACSSTGAPGSWVLESSGICGGVTGHQSGTNKGPGGNKFYDTQVYPPWGEHDYASAGAPLQLPGRAEVAYSAGDPNNEYYTGGIRFNRNDNGSKTRGWIAHPNNVANWQTFGKAQGIGDVTALINTAPLEIGNRVWKDTNRNGIQDADETPIANVTVHLVDSSNTVVGTTTTASDGTYYFNDADVTGGLLPNTHYTIKFDNAPDYTTGHPLAGLALTVANAGSDVAINSKATPGTGGFGQIAVTTGGPGQDNFNYDAGFAPPVCAIGQVTFVDTNGNGTQDTGEPVLPGVKVTLFNADGTPAVDAAGNPVAPVTTGSDGKYVFDDLPCGSYYETFTPPAGYTPTTQQPPSDTQVNSTPDSTGKTPTFPTGPGQPDNRAPQPGDGVTTATTINPTIDAGYTPILAFSQDKTVDHQVSTPGSTLTYTITAKNTSTVDATGVTGTDTLPADVTFVSATPSAGTYDDTTGVWTIGDMVAGDTETLTITATISATAPDNDILRNRFELTPPTPPGGPTPPVTVGHPCTDNPDQSCATTVLPPVCAVGQVTFIDSNGNGTQDVGEDVLPGVTVKLFNPDGSPAVDAAGNPIAPVVTGADGKYVFDFLTCGQYYETFTPPGGYEPTTQLPPSPTQVNSTPDDTGKTPVFTTDSSNPDNRAPQPGDGVTDATTINPTIDAGYAPVLSFSQDKTVDLAVADPGETVTYTITAKNTSTLDATSVVGTDTLPAGLTYVSSTTAAGTYDGATGVWDIGDLAAGQTVTVTVHATVNDDTPGGSRLVNRFQLSPPNGPGGNPPPIDVGHPCTDNPNQSCAVTTVPVPVCAIGQVTFIDNNGNGVQDSGEPVLPGVTVTLVNPDGSPAVDSDGNPVAPTVTNSRGKYVFDNLACGQYYETFTPPAGYTPTVQQPPSLTAVNSTPDNTGKTPVFTTDTSGADNRAPKSGDMVNSATSINPTIDAGFLPPPTCAIGQITFIDSNGNGTQDTGEPALPGVSVSLFNPDGSAATDANGQPVTPVVTGSDGKYVFDNLACGSYYEIFSPPDGFLPTTQLPPSDTQVNSVPDDSGVTPVFVAQPGQPDNRAPQTGDGVTVATDINPTIDAGYLPQLTFSQDKTVDLAAARPGATVTYTVTAKNTSTQPATGVTGQETLPTDVTFVSATPSQGTFDPTTQLWDIGSMAAGASVTVQIKVTVKAGTAVGTQLINRFQLTPPVPPGQLAPPIDVGHPCSDNAAQSCAATTVPPPVCAIGQVAFVDLNGNGTQDSGEPVLAGVVVRLFNPDGTPAKDAAGNVLGPVTTDSDGKYVFDGLACGQYYETFTPPPGYTPTQQQPPSDTQVNSTPDDNGQTPVFTTQPGEPDNRAPQPGDGVTTGEDINPTIDVGYLPVWSFRQNKVVDHAVAGPGTILTYTVTVKNTSPAAAPGVTGVDTLPAHVTYVSSSASQGSFNPSTGTWTIGTLGGGKTATLKIKARIDADAAPGSLVLNRFEVNPPTPPGGTPPTVIIDHPCTDHPAQSCAVTTIPTPTLSFSQDKTVDLAAANPGGQVVYTITARNTSTTDASGLTGTDKLPAHVTFVSATASLGSYNSSTGVWTIGTLPAEGSATLKIVVRLSATIAAGSSVVNRFQLTPPPVSNPPGGGGGSSGGSTPPVTVVHPCTDDADQSCAVTKVPPPPCALIGVVWLDLNHNGILDAGENPVSGVTVTLLDAQGNPIASVAPVVTGADGKYEIDHLACGSYRVRFTNLPPGTSFTTPNAPGSTPQTASQASQVDGITISVTLAPGQHGPLNAGLVSSTSPQSLAFTGLDVAALIGLAVALLGVGFLVVLAGRRRRRPVG